MKENCRLKIFAGTFAKKGEEMMMCDMYYDVCVHNV